ncbi:hypothetical protein DTL42_10895 [Bremerella cremea]|uniref:Bacterial surface antigen (D15) domain-containing protein n=1 Tax=Bremerella cremea TaxID=1031537 RepID=A0A368KS15_9BACT|nr:BamA/TamA family outer membrane protein [Bremerella cremea]RCS50605.1 hypothetical protein DTL42_10895 [Bremerella cremea]
MDRSGQLLKITIALGFAAMVSAGWKTAAAQSNWSGTANQVAQTQWNNQAPANQAYSNGTQGQQGYYRQAQATSPGNPNQYRSGMPASGAPIPPSNPYPQQPVQQVQYAQPTQAVQQPAQYNPQPAQHYAQPQAGYAPQSEVQYQNYPQAGRGYDRPILNNFAAPPVPNYPPGYMPPPGMDNTGRPMGGAPIFDPPLGPDAIIAPNPYMDPARMADLTIRGEEAQTGRFQFGVGVNSDAGVNGSVVIDERNFDWTRFPTSPDDIWNGRAWRGAGQGFRIEAMPGSQVQRYMVSFSDPYLFNTRVSLNLSAYLFNRIYRDWDEQRVGGRVGLGYRLTPDLSTSVSLRMEDVDVYDPRVPGVPQLDSVLGSNDVYTGSWSIVHDTRDVAFAPTEGHMFQINLEQAFGQYNYSRAEVDFRQYFLLGERPDGSGRHTLGFSAKAGFSGSDTPIFENFFAGGFSTLRGFRFRRTGPIVNDVYTGGPFRVLGSVEYMFPITADDMIKGVIFTDVGTVEESTKIVWDDFDVSPGFGLRISVPALGQAPIALDFAFPVNHADTDETQVFSFFVGAAR